MLQSRDADRSTLSRVINLPDQPVEQALGSCLKSFFAGVVASPIPDRIQQLAIALEDALDRGDLRTQDALGSRPSL